MLSLAYAVVSPPDQRGGANDIHSMLYEQEVEDKVISPEKAEEAKLKARYPNLGAKPGGSDFLRKRLQKGVCV